MTLRRKILTATGAVALTVTFGVGAAYAHDHREHGPFCFQVNTTRDLTTGDGPHLHDTRLGPDLWLRCVAHAPRD